MSKCKFKVGDKVVLKTNGGYVFSQKIKGLSGTIVSDEGANCYSVLIDIEDDYISGKNNADIGWCFTSYGLSPLTEKKYKLKHFEKDVRQWNERCGNVVATKEMSLEETCAVVLPQAKVILEEAKELLKVCEEKNELELLDGAVDVLVTSLRLISLLGERYDILAAAQEVMKNNHLKYTEHVEVVTHDPNWNVEGTEVVCTEVDGKEYLCLKDVNGKVRKPHNLPKVGLSKYVGGKE